VTLLAVVILVVTKERVLPLHTNKTRCSSTIRYDTKDEIN